ncbi:MAG: HD domain-containing protein [Desulfobulbaceae bacterium]|nr:HD domain-containing protein [Desulfobulbaceae bacterium]
MNTEPSYAELYHKVKDLENQTTRIAGDAVEKVNKCEAKYQAILDTVDAHLTLIDRNFTVIWANRNARKLFGENIVGKNCHEACQGSNNPCGVTKCIVRDAFRSGIVQRHEAEMTDQQGRRRFFSGAAHVVRRGSNGEATAVVKVYNDITEQKKTEYELKQSMLQLRKNLAGTIQAMAMTVETRDPYTAGHQRRTSDIARNIARQMKLSRQEVDGIRMAGVIHDLGKICVPAEILSKPGKIGATEFSLIQNHPQTGYDILKGIEFNWPVAEIVRQHHERIDGSGYPFGLKGEQIRIEAKIIGVADVIEAMSSHRPYRPSLGINKAFSEIMTNSGTLYDADVVNATVDLFSRRKFDFH